VSSRAKVIAGTAAVALVAAGASAFAAVKLTSTSHTVTAPAVTSPFRDGLGSYGLGDGRLGGRGFGGGLGPGDDGRDFGFRGFLGSGMGRAATYLGLSTAQLRSDLQSGQTLAQIAKEQGKTVDGLLAAMLAQAKKTLDTAVSQGLITQAQANQIASGLAARMKDRVNGVRTQGGFGGPGNQGGGIGTFGGTSNA
jgi:hypothetical protein